MPILKIFYDESLDKLVRANKHEINSGLAKMMRNVLLADPAKCQVVLSAATLVSPLPVYIDMQYRANEQRSRDIVMQAMQETAAVVRSSLNTGVRIRAFDIDQSVLHALDIEEPAS